jgi:acyl-CoA hydrolase
MKTLARLSDAFGSGDRVFVPCIAGESALLAAELRADPQRARDVHFIGVQFPGIDTIDYVAAHECARWTSWFMSPAMRRGMAQGRAHLRPADYAGIARDLLGALPVDVAIAQVSTPDSAGWCSAGLSADFMPLAWTRARRRIVHVNPRMPPTRGSFRIRLQDVDGWVEGDQPLLEFKDPPASDLDLRIATLAAGCVHDGDTLQFGIGTIPLALGRALAGHRRLKIRAGMVTQTLRMLSNAGALDEDSAVVTGVALGDASFHDFVARHPGLWFTDVRETHAVPRLAVIPSLVAINSAVEVDLFGQVNAERMGGTLLAGAGGLPAFAQGALQSPGGRLLICLRSTANRGTLSRIVPALGSGGVCTLPSHLADTVITEHGIASIRHLDIDARAQALIGIADPDHRDALATEWARMRSAF